MRCSPLTSTELSVKQIWSSFPSLLKKTRPSHSTLIARDRHTVNAGYRCPQLLEEQAYLYNPRSGDFQFSAESGRLASPNVDVACQALHGPLVADLECEGEGWDDSEWKGEPL